jgi:putative two-component system response regulator
MIRDSHSTPTILIVDDDALNRAVLEAMLAPLGYHLDFAVNGEDSLHKAKINPPDVILMDIAMPGMNGFGAVQALRDDPSTEQTPIVMVSALYGVDKRIEALRAGADDYLLKPVDMAELRMRVATLIKRKRHQDHEQRHMEQLRADLKEQSADLLAARKTIHNSSLEAIFRLVAAAEYRDDDTGQHIQRMSIYAAALAQRMGLPTDQVEMMAAAAQMHDIGKIGIPDSILRKPGKLDADEFEIMREHTTIGADLLKESELDMIRMAETIALMHHERWDGSGYPQGLKRTQIPIEGRIAAVADVFDALTSPRCYRVPSSFPPDEALKMILEGRGSHFDPDVLDAFVEIWPEILGIMQEYAPRVTAELQTS